MPLVYSNYLSLLVPKECGLHYPPPSRSGGLCLCLSATFFPIWDFSNTVSAGLLLSSSTGMSPLASCSLCALRSVAFLCFFSCCSRATCDPCHWEYFFLRVLYFPLTIVSGSRFWSFSLLASLAAWVSFLVPLIRPAGDRVALRISQILRAAPAGTTFLLKNLAVVSLLLTSRRKIFW